MRGPTDKQYPEVCNLNWNLSRKEVECSISWLPLEPGTWSYGSVLVSQTKWGPDKGAWGEAECINTRHQ